MKLTAAIGDAGARTSGGSRQEAKRDGEKSRGEAKGRVCKCQIGE